LGLCNYTNLGKLTSWKLSELGAAKKPPDREVSGSENYFCCFVGIGNNKLLNYASVVWRVFYFSYCWGRGKFSLENFQEVVAEIFLQPFSDLRWELGNSQILESYLRGMECPLFSRCWGREKFSSENFSAEFICRSFYLGEIAVFQTLVIELFSK